MLLSAITSKKPGSKRTCYVEQSLARSATYFSSVFSTFRQHLKTELFQLSYAHIQRLFYFLIIYLLVIVLRVCIFKFSLFYCSVIFWHLFCSSQFIFHHFIAQRRCPRLFGGALYKFISNDWVIDWFSPEGATKPVDRAASLVVSHACLLHRSIVSKSI